jgi:hypothetical protein
MNEVEETLRTHHLQSGYVAYRPKDVR